MGVHENIGRKLLKNKKGTDCWDWEKYDFNDFISRISYESIKINS